MQNPRIRAYTRAGALVIFHGIPRRAYTREGDARHSTQSRRRSRERTRAHTKLQPTAALPGVARPRVRRAIPRALREAPILKCGITKTTRKTPANQL